MATVLTLLRLHWQRRWRRGRSQTLLRRIAYVLLGGFVGVVFVGWIGLVFPGTLAESGIPRAPHDVLNEHLLSVFAGLLAIRFLLQRSVGDEWRSFLTLPVRRTTLAHAMQGSAAVSLLNLLPLVAVTTLAKSTIAPAATIVGTTVWTLGGLLMVAATHVTNVGLRAAWAQRWWGVVAGTGAGVVGLIAADVLGVGLVRATSAWLFGGLLEAAVLPTAVLGVTTVGLTLASTAALRRWTYDWVKGGAQHESRGGPTFSVRGRDSLSSLVLLEVKLILRNRGPREQFLLGLGVAGFIVFMILGGTLPSFERVTAPLMLGTLLPITYGQFAFAWHGGHFDALLLRVPPRRLVRATVLVLAGLALGPMLLAISVVVWQDLVLALPLGAFALYHAGVTAPVLVWTSVLWNRTWVNPEQSRFSATGGPIRGMTVLLGLSVPPVLWSVVGGLSTVPLGMAGLGLAGLGTASFWLPHLEDALRHRRHDMLQGFRGEWLSPHTWHW